MSGRVLCPVFCWLLIQLSSTNLMYSQEYSWKYYTVSDGLPQTQIYCLYQDSKGYIWIGTKGGLSRFDGLEFENFTSKDGLIDDFISDIQEDESGGFFIITRNGTNYLKNGTLTSQLPGVDPELILLHADNDGRLWLYSREKGVIIQDTSNFSNLNIPQECAVELEKVGNMYIDRKTDRFIYNNQHGKSVFRDGTEFKIMHKAKKDITFHFSRKGEIVCMDQDSVYLYEDGNIIPLFGLRDFYVVEIYSHDQIYLMDKSSRSWLYQFDGKSISRFQQRFNMVMRVLVDDEQNLWVGTESGLWRLQSRGFQNFLSERNNNFYTWNVAEDTNGHILFGSFLHGMKGYNGEHFYDIPVKHLFHNNGNQFFYSGNHVDDEMNVLFGTYCGILKYDGYNFEWIESSISTGTILYIYYDASSGKYFATSASKGLFELDRENKITIHNDRKSQEHTGLETSILIDKYARIWLSGKHGITIKENGNWRNLPDDKDSIPIGAISMLKDHMDNIWLGSNDGLYFYDYHRLRKVAAEFFDQQIGVLNLTAENELLIGSIRGIGLLDLNMFYSDGQEELRYYDADNGFLGTECKHNSSYKDKNGHIWICTSDRVVKVSPLDLLSNPNPPRVYIRSISAPSATMEWEPVLNMYDTDIVHTLSANHDDIRFNYHAISHTAPMGVHYQTMLQGYDSEWSAASPERYRTYTKLPPGRYTFKVKAANIDGVWTEEPTAISIEILPEWHERMSVKIGGLLAAIVSASIIGFLYSEQLRRKKVIAEGNAKKMTQLQINSMKRLIDPHFTFNAINSIAAMVYKENREEAYTYFTKFSKLIRSVFDASEETTRTIKEEMAFIEDYLDIEKMRFKERFDYKIEIAPQVNYDWKIPKMIVQIYVENSIKHGLIARDSGGMIEVKLDTDANFLIIKVRDNGIGRKSGMQNKTNPDSLGRGTSIMREYFNLLNKYNEQKITSETIDLKDADGHPAGTEVQVFIPLNFKYNL
jgi:ligand-binding sensor domain-containing protein/two-component sensor histidine kinase